MYGLCLVFDIDDTLYLERDYVRSGFEYVGRWAGARLGISDFAQQAWRLFVEGHRGNVFDQVLEAAGIQRSPSVVGHMVALYRSHPAKIKLPPDSLACLDSLRGRVSLAVISDGPRDAQRRKVSALKLGHWFHQILLTDEWGARFRKPSPLPFRRIQEHFRLPSRRCCYVGDNPIKDFVAPRQLGWSSIRVRRLGGLYSTVEARKETEPDYELPDLGPLPGLLAEL